MCEPAGNTFHDVLGLLRIFGQIASESIQNIDNAPLVTVIHRSQQLLHKTFSELEQRLSFEVTANRQ